MNKSVCFSSNYSVGCTFLDWSLHFLSGAKEFYSVEHKNWIPLCDNPLTDLNAHVHQKNQPFGLQQTKDYIDQLCLNLNDQLSSLYVFPLETYATAQLLGHDPTQQLDDKTFSRMLDYAWSDYVDALDHCLHKNFSLIYVNLSKKNILYTDTVRSTERLFLSSASANSAEQITMDMQQVFFQDSIEKWTKLGLVNRWDIRERMALDMRPFRALLCDRQSFNRKLPHLFIDAQSLWYNGHRTIERIMQFVGLKLDASRWNHWVLIYAQWQQKQLKILQFEFDLDNIIQSIKHGWFYDISGLTFQQEAIIQHCLIYQHGLNLKTWQLEKFPDNTLDLHMLLEPNLHPVPAIY